MISRVTGLIALAARMVAYTVVGVILVWLASVILPAIGIPLNLPPWTNGAIAVVAAIIAWKR